MINLLDTLDRAGLSRALARVARLIELTPTLRVDFTSDQHVAHALTHLHSLTAGHEDGEDHLGLAATRLLLALAVRLDELLAEANAVELNNVARLLAGLD